MGCELHRDCNLGEACIDSVCSVIVDGRDCLAGDVFGNGQLCFNSKCRTACGSDTDCTEGRICIDHGNEMLVCTDRCTTDAQCSAGEECLDSICFVKQGIFSRAWDWIKDLFS